jgi:hypothetical protein
MSETDLSQPSEKSGLKSAGLKSALVFMGAGALMALSVAALLLPRVMLWYFEPPVVAGWGSCGPSVEWALKIYQRVEWGALVFGGLVGLWGFFKYKKLKNN